MDLFQLPPPHTNEKEIKLMLKKYKMCYTKCCTRNKINSNIV